MILILGHRTDPHIEMVTRHLDQRGSAWSLLPTIELGDTAAVSWRLDTDQPVALATVDGRSIDMSDVTSVWNRRLLRPYAEAHTQEPIVRQYVVEQWWHTLHGALRSTNARWVNTIDSLARARSKPGQLVDARRTGLATPPTLVSSDPDEIRRFAAGLPSSSFITKVVSPGTPIVDFGEDQYMIYTQRIDLDDLDEDSIRSAPAMFQPEIEKAFEVRVTVVGSEVLGCRIDSGASQRTELDWRHYDFERVGHSPIGVPMEVEQSLLALCRHYGLRFGAADFVVGHEGEWTFLELNANGQWGWIEEHAGLPISQRIAVELLRSHSGP